jgi:uncharacterized protein with ATP-grasp and redox domains
MKTYLDCYPCFLRQALSASRRAGATVEQQQQILHLTLQELAGLPVDATPPRMAFDIHRQVREQTQNADPYREDKAQATRQALDLYPMLKDKVAASSNPLETAARIAIAGNIIDLGVAESYDLEANLERVLTRKLAVNGLVALYEALQEDPSVLYLADNAGETVFDRVLIETIDRPVTYVVKASPIINDATLEDAVAAGIDRIADIIDNGSNAPGTLLDHCSDEFVERFHQAELVIAKGQANYESLSREPAPIFFLLQAKCPVIAGDLDVATGDIILERQDIADIDD